MLGMLMLVANSLQWLAALTAMALLSTSTTLWFMSDARCRRSGFSWRCRWRWSGWTMRSGHYGRGTGGERGQLPAAGAGISPFRWARSEEHPSELQSLMRISYA